MDSVIRFAITELIAMTYDSKKIKKFLPAIGKVWLSIELAAKRNPDLAAELERRRLELD